MSLLIPEARVETTKVNGARSEDLVDKAIWNWREQLRRPVRKDHPIWANYVEAAIIHDNDVVEALSRSMDILLVFSGLFSAVVTTFVVQVEQVLAAWDPASRTVTILEAILRGQLTPLLRILDPTFVPPRLGTYNAEDITYPRISVVLWYVSLDCALLVAGGAVCMRQWLLDYRQANSSNRVPYNRAIHHQESYSSLKRWYIPEFGDLLGTVVLVYLVLFFAGIMFHLSVWRTGNRMFWDIAGVALAIYCAFLVFTIIVGIFVPTSPYKTPISNLVKRVGIPRSVFQGPMANPWYITAQILVLIIAVALVYTKTVDIDIWLILFWVALMMLTVGFGLRNGLKVGRRARFVPIMGFAIGLLTASCLALSNASIYLDLRRAGVSTVVLFPFTLVVILLSHRFATNKGQKYFPTGALLLSAAGIVVALLVAWIFSQGSCNWAIQLSGVITCISTMTLCMRSLLREGVIEEDTREAEALGWLITQANDLRTLHSALACIPSIANTPFRRKIVLDYAHQTLALIINSLVDAPGRRCLIESGGGNDNADLGGDDNLDRLMFYVTCLAELSQGYVATQHGRSSKKNTRAVRPWISENWHRFLTLRPSQDIFTRELRFLHDWHRPSGEDPSDLLYAHLNTLSEHKNTCLSITSQAALFQLYPSNSLVNDISSWPTRFRSQFQQNETSDSHGMLVELRMVTTRVIDACHSSTTLEPSILRFLYYYCSTALNAWTSWKGSHDVGIFEAAMLLGYLVLENDSRVIGVTGWGDSTPMKAARCLMSLKRWHDRNREGRGAILAMDKRLHDSLANSILSATKKYLLVGSEQNCRPMQLDEDMSVDENSIVIGMKYLEQALLQIAAQEWPVQLLNQVTSALEAFYSIVQDSSIELLPLDLQYDATSLMMQLKSRLASSEATARDRVSAMRMANRILNKVPDHVAQLLVLDDSSSLLAIVSSMAREKSIDCRVAAFSTLLDTRIFNRRIPRGKITERSEELKLSSLSRMPNDVRLDVIPNRGYDLVELYNDIMNYSCLPLLESSAIDAPLHRIYIKKVITMSSLLVHTLSPESLPSSFFEYEKYPMVLALISSNDDIGLVTLSIRQSAIQLFAKLWSLSYQRVGQETESNVADVFWRGTCLGGIKNGLEVLAAHCMGMELKYILLWVDLLEEACEYPEAAEAVFRSGIVEAFCNIVGWIDFGQPIEELRGKVFDRLIRLQGRISSPNFEQQI